MAVTYGFYNSLNGDRKYDATQISSMFDGLIIDGVFASIGSCFVVKAAGGNVVNVGTGKAWFNKTWTLNDAILPLEAPESEVLLDRIDAVVLEVDTLERVNSIKFVKGVPSSSPVNPTLASGPTLFQYPLCYIYRPAGSTEITQAQITNMVGTEATPFVTGILQTISLDELLGQWQDELDQFVAREEADFTNWMNDKKGEYDNWFDQMKADLLAEKALLDQWIASEQEDFLAWFNQMKEILDEDAVTNILNLINDNKEESDAKFELIDSRLADVDSRLADYEYQTPIINGTQIQLQKRSDTKILKFKLNTDLSGGAITISLDGGVTSKPLVDIDGVAVTELSKGFVEVVEDAVNFTYAPKGGKGQKGEFIDIPDFIKDFIKVAESDNYGGVINALAYDSTYLYVGGSGKKIWKINPTNMSKVAESGEFAKRINSLARFATPGGSLLYVGGINDQNQPRIWIINPLNMNINKEGPESYYGTYGEIRAIAYDDDRYIYIGGTAQKVLKIRYSDLGKVAESDSYGGNINALVYAGGYLYAGGTTIFKVWKIDPTNMSKVAESDSYGGVINALAYDGTYLYVGGTSTRNVWKVWKINPTNMSKVAESDNYGGIIKALAYDGTYLYVGGNSKKIWKINPTNMSKVAESDDYGVDINALAYLSGGTITISLDDGKGWSKPLFDGTYLYVGGTSNSVWKLLWRFN